MADDPVPSRFLDERSRPVIVPLGQSLFLDAARDRSGGFDVQGDGRSALADDRKAEVPHPRTIGDGWPLIPP